MASFSAGTTFSDGVANDVTAAKLGALVNNATPTSGLIQDRTTETITATNDTLLIGDASDSNNLKKITVANFAQTLPTAKITTGTVNSATLGTTTGTLATFTTLTAGTTTSTAATIPTLTAGTTTGTAATFSGDLTIADKIIHSGDTNTAIRFPAADTVTVETSGTERLRIDSSGNVGIGETNPDGKLHIYGSGSATNSPSTSASLGGTIAVQDGGGSANNGGMVMFGALQGFFASIKGLLQDGASNTAGDLIFATRNAPTDSTLTECMRIDQYGNVGIGANPTAVSGIGVNPVIGKNNLIMYNAGDIGHVLLTDNAATRTQQIGFGAQGLGVFDAGLKYDTSSRDLQVYVYNLERLRIDSSGDVSIGTATALSKLHVHGNITLSNTTTATSAGTSTLTPPATVAGYLTVSINGTSRKIPYYAT